MMDHISFNLVPPLLWLTSTNAHKCKGALEWYHKDVEENNKIRIYNYK